MWNQSIAGILRQVSSGIGSTAVEIARPTTLWTIAMVRMRSDVRTRDYVARRTGEGLSKKEIHRCLKRYIVRELYPLILADLKDSALSA